MKQEKVDINKKLLAELGAIVLHYRFPGRNNSVRQVRVEGGREGRLL